MEHQPQTQESQSSLVASTESRKMDIKAGEPNQLRAQASTSSFALSSSGSPAIDAFFSRCGLSSSSRQRCWDFIHSHYPSPACRPLPELAIYECPTQGYCSYTFCVGDFQIVQFRPRAHQLNNVIATVAREVYGVLAPATRFLGILKVAPLTDEDGALSRADSESLFVYSMTRIPGVSLADFRRNSPGRSMADMHLQRAIIVRDFARFISLGWSMALAGRRSGSGAESVALPFSGRLGPSLRWRLERMREKLPPRFRPIVEDVLCDLEKIESLPWVLTHGDIGPDNIMVEGAGPHGGTGWRPGSLRGLLDWAESEYLPFGVGLYGVEELFGQRVRQWEEKPDGSHPKSRFVYYPTAGDLRRLFWEELEKAVPRLITDCNLRGTVEQARLLGIFLWHGFAFDDGKLNRVVQEGRDDEEIQKLDMFLFGSDHPRTRASADIRVGTSGIEKDRALRESAKKQRHIGKGVKRGWTYIRHLQLAGLAFRKG